MVKWYESPSKDMIWGGSIFERIEEFEIEKRKCRNCFFFKVRLAIKTSLSGSVQEEATVCDRFNEIRYIKSTKQACILFKDRKEKLEEERIANKIW